MIRGRDIGCSFVGHVVGIISIHVGSKQPIVDARTFIEKDEGVDRSRTRHIRQFPVNKIPGRPPIIFEINIHGHSAAAWRPHKAGLRAFPRIIRALIHLHVVAEVRSQLLFAHLLVAVYEII